jgi:hypothetical protein
MLPLDQRHARYHLLEFFLGHVLAGRTQSLSDVASNGFEIRMWSLHCIACRGQAGSSRSCATHTPGSENGATQPGWLPRRGPLPGAPAGYNGRAEQLIRMLRILGGCIEIAPCGGTPRNTRAGNLRELPLGMRHSPNGALLRNNKSKRGSRATSLPANTERSEASAYIRSIRINLFAFMSS